MLDHARTQKVIAQRIRLPFGSPSQPSPHATHRTRVSALTVQLLWLLILAIPIASVAWTVTHEDVFRETRDYCKEKSGSARKFWQRKLFYLFTCEYCFSHYVTAIFFRSPALSCSTPIGGDT